MNQKTTREDVKKIVEELTQDLTTRLQEALGLQDKLGDGVAQGTAELLPAPYDCKGATFTCGDYTCTGAVGCAGTFSCTIKFAG